MGVGMGEGSPLPAVIGKLEAIRAAARSAEGVCESPCLGVGTCAPADLCAALTRCRVGGGGVGWNGGLICVGLRGKEHRVVKCGW